MAAEPSEEVSAALGLLDHAEALLKGRDVHAAIQVFDHAEGVGEDPDRCAGGRWFAHMLIGDFQAAWQESDEIRRRRGVDPHRFWNGEDLQDKQVIVRCLHGLGDAVQMLRYAPRLKAVCQKLVVEVPPRFVKLARCFAGVDAVVTWGEDAPMKVPDWDVQVEVMELPYIFRTQAAELPIATKYLELPSTLRAKTSVAMGSRERPRVGVVWAAGEWNPARSLPFEFVERLVNEADCEFWNLQGGEGQSAWSDLGQNAGLRDAEECGEGVLALAGVIAELDLVITVDTLASHLAGALGTPAWVLLQNHADWRWMMERDDSPWYPSVSLHRQRSQGDWSGVVETVRERLGVWAKQHSRDVRMGAGA